MTTKEQERKALEQIRKIVAGLGEESYIGKAFEGCFEVAQDNIDNDFWNSNKDRVETLCVANWENIKKVDELKKQGEELQKEIQETKEDAEYWRKQYNMMNNRFKELSEYNTQNWNKFREQEDRADALEAEITKLKAKLYDLITK